VASATDRAAAAPPELAGASFSDLGFAVLLVAVTFAQLDAVGNRVSEALPMSLYGAAYALAIVLAAAAWIGDRGTRLAGIGAPGTRLALAFLLWAAVAWTLSEHRDEGWDYLIRLMKGAGLLFLVALLVDTPARLRAGIWTMILSGLVSALIVYGDVATGSRLVSTADAAVTAEFGGVARSAGGSDENPTTAAHMLLVSVALAIGLFAAVGKVKVGAALVMALCVGALALMAARSALVGLAVAILLLLWTLRRERIFPLLLVGLVGLVAAAVLLAPGTLDRIYALSNWAQDPTLFRRATYLKVGLDLLQQSPIWGVGPGNYPFYFVGDEYRFLPGRAPVLRELHNTYLDVAVEVGLVGLLLFLALARQALIDVAKASVPVEIAPFGKALLFALAALLVASFFMPNKDMRYLWLLLGLALQYGRLARAGRATP
jgi:O-antigen ligase